MQSIIIIFPVLVVFSFLWLSKPWASGQIQVSPCCVASLPLLLFVVVFPKVKPFITYYNSFQSNYGLTMPRCCCSLLPVTESDPLDQSLFSLENSSHSNDDNFNGIPCGAVGIGSPVYSQVSESSLSLNMSHSIVSPEVSLGVPVHNRFASLSDECATPAVLSDFSDEETVKQRSRGGSDHSSDDLEISAESMMHLSSSQEFQRATLGSMFEKQQEKTHGGKLASSEAYSVSIMCDTSNCVHSQAPNQKASQQLLIQLQQSTTQKLHLANATPTTISTDQHITMSSRRLQSTSPSLHQPKEIRKAEASQKFYSIDYNSQALSSQHQVVREKDTVARDNRETRFHYAPSHHCFKQFSPSFQ